MKLYIGNPTGKDHDFLYRLVGDARPSPYVVRVPANKFVRLSQDLSQPQIDALVEQNAKYGMRPVTEKSRDPHVVTLLYSVDKPIVHEKIEAFYVSNQEVLEAQGEQMRKEVALSVQQGTSEAAESVGLPVSAVEVETYKVERNGSKPELMGTVRVTKNEGPSREVNQPPPRSRATGRRAPAKV